MTRKFGRPGASFASGIRTEVKIRRSVPRSSDDGNELGFTLVELLIAIVLMPLVIGALSVLVLSVLQLQGGVSNRISSSSNSQVASGLLLRDVQSASFLTTKSALACGSLGTQILGLQSQGNQVYISYTTVINSGKNQLFRQLCTGGVTATPVSSTLVSDNTQSGLAFAVTCSATITCNPGSAWISTAGVKGVTISITETTTNNKGNYSYSYAMSATPRAWSNASGGQPNDPFPINPIVLLNTGTCPQTVLSEAGSSKITSSAGSAPITIDSPCANSIVMTGTSSINATAIDTSNSNLNSVNAANGITPPPQVYQAATPDPFATLTAPANPTTAGNGSCSGSPLVCTPGKYTTAQSFSAGGTTATFNAGNYDFVQPVSVRSSQTVVFGPGNYLFEGGLTLSNGAIVTFGTGVYIFEGNNSGVSPTNALSVIGNAKVSSGAGGVLFYMPNGAVSFGNGVTVSLQGMNAYDGISIWDAGASPSNPLTVGGGSTVGDTYGGLYAPNGPITVANGGVLAASYVVANSLNLSGNAQLAVG